MASMDYDEAAAERLETVYRGTDIAAQRRFTLAQLALSPGERVIDIGSGPGFLAAEMAEVVGPAGAVLGVDISEALLARARARNAHAWLSYAWGDATALPTPDAAFDVAVSVQVAEYVADTEGFCAELARVLRPGGRGLVVATDWDAVAWHSEDPARMARMLKAFEPHCADPRLPRTLAPRLSAAGLTVTGATGFPIINLAASPGSYSLTARAFLSGYVRSAGTVDEAEIRAWEEELDALDARGASFFSSTRIFIAVTKPG